MYITNFEISRLLRGLYYVHGRYDYVLNYYPARQYRQYRNYHQARRYRDYLLFGRLTPNPPGGTHVPDKL